MRFDEPQAMSEQAMTPSEVLAVLDSRIKPNELLGINDSELKRARAAVAELAQQNEVLKGEGETLLTNFINACAERDALRRRVEEADLFHDVMRCLQDMRTEHGLCQPRERRACTNCNAWDRLEEIIRAYRGPRAIASAKGDATK